MHYQCNCNSVKCFLKIWKYCEHVFLACVMNDMGIFLRLICSASLSAMSLFFMFTCVLAGHMCGSTAIVINVRCRKHRECRRRISEQWRVQNGHSECERHHKCKWVKDHRQWNRQSFPEKAAVVTREPGPFRPGSRAMSP